MARVEARLLTDQIKTGLDNVWELMHAAYSTRAWASLGYASWDEYCAGEFGTSRLRLPREERQEVVASLRESGLSTRAIASAAGIDRKTVRNDLSQVARKGPPADGASPTADGRRGQRASGVAVAVEAGHRDTPGPEDPAPHPEPEEPVNEHPAPAVPATVTGTDGKTYRPTVARKPPKKQTNIRAVISDALTDIARARHILAALTGQQLTAQDEEARRTWAANLNESLVALTGFANALTKGD
jgi:transposase-like protein